MSGVRKAAWIARILAVKNKWELEKVPSLEISDSKDRVAFPYLFFLLP